MPVLSARKLLPHLSSSEQHLSVDARWPLRGSEICLHGRRLSRLRVRLQSKATQAPCSRSSPQSRRRQFFGTPHTHPSRSACRLPHGVPNQRRFGQSYVSTCPVFVEAASVDKPVRNLTSAPNFHCPALRRQLHLARLDDMPAEHRRAAAATPASPPSWSEGTSLIP